MARDQGDAIQTSFTPLWQEI